MRYIQNIERPAKLERGSKVIFTLDNKTIYNGVVTKNNFRASYYIIFSKRNSIVFDELGLDRTAFVRNIVGYSPHGDWPEVDTLEDLSAVLDALLKVNRPVEEPTIEEPKKSSSHSEWDWLLG